MREMPFTKLHEDLPDVPYPIFPSAAYTIPPYRTEEYLAEEADTDTEWSDALQLLTARSNGPLFSKVIDPADFFAARVRLLSAPSPAVMVNKYLFGRPQQLPPILPISLSYLGSAIMCLRYLAALAGLKAIDTDAPACYATERGYLQLVMTDPNPQTSPYYIDWGPERRRYYAVGIGPTVMTLADYEIHENVYHAGGLNCGATLMQYATCGFADEVDSANRAEFARWGWQ